VVITLRADFYDRPLLHEKFSRLIEARTALVLPMTGEELHKAIQSPADRVGAILEKGLIPSVINDVINQPGTLPLLQYALTELFEQRSGRMLTCQSYQAIGGVTGALGLRAEQIFNTLDQEAQQAAKQLFLRLVTIGEGVDDTRRRISWSEIEQLPESSFQQVADVYGQSRLLTFDHDPTTREATIEVAHEALLKEWERLAGWLDNSRGDLRMQRLLDEMAAEWLAADQDSSYLLRGSRLVQFEDWAAGSPLAISEDENALLQASLLARQEQEIKEAMRREKEQKQISIGLASQALQELEGPHPERSVLLALEALEKYPYTWQAERALGTAVLNNKLRMILTHGDYVHTADWSPDGTQILTGSQDGTVRLWDAASGEELWRISEGGPNWASWSPDGQSILLIGEKKSTITMWDYRSINKRYSLNVEGLKDKISIKTPFHPWSPSGEKYVLYSTQGKAFLFDTFTGHQIHKLSNHEGELSTARWSPNGDLIATSGFEDGKITIWDPKSGTMLYSLQAGFEDNRTVFANWSPSGDQFAIRGQGGARIFSTDSGEELFSLQIPRVYVQSVSWSSDASLLISTGKDDGIARMWDAVSGKEIESLDGLVQAYGVDWSPSGDYATISGADGNVHIWNKTTGREIDTINVTRSYVVVAKFSPDGKQILAVGETNSIKIIDLSTALTTFRYISHGNLSNPAWSPDGDSYAFGTLVPPDSPVKIYEASTGDEVLTLSGYGNFPVYIYWSPIGDRLLITSQNEAHVWDTVTGKQIIKFDIHKDDIRPAGWSPDGKLVATGSEDGEIFIWDPSTGKPHLNFSGHHGGIRSVNWSCDGSQILSTSDAGEAMIWDITTGNKYIEFLPEGYNNFVPSSSWSQDNQHVFILTADGDVFIFDSHTGAKLSQLSTSPVSYITRFSLSPSEERILIGGHDGTAKVWNIGTGDELISYEVGGYVKAYYSPDGNRVLIASTEGDHGSLQVFPTWQTTQELVDYARQHKVFRQLTQEERERFGLLPL